ncbi:uncharacterized protein LOC102717336 [Oryza brachyantha]|uniref:Uncharacterized protein n=1 Tax=Oryza brachyantha TaxID=4533 RepID=J3LV64_ORYBR|nr:uncharacterized protein LOC102717336 [Oryza brachyantha]XP_015692271.1 uncharacterized protein LOC102717336 [Oryza brachyantha]XP_015692272.1 uncharacterized protein LOC102717336 [Oryza brachyantha]XP_015692273.1 uncharacterized protein LOC102717336 [Oryza brachyantha]
MAEIVRSAIVGEAVSRIFSGIISKHEDNSDEGDNIERLEMAHIKIEAAIETSNKWQITDMPLLCWQKKLKRASQECDDMLHRCKQRAIEDNEIEDQVEQSSFPRRVTHATKLFILSFIGHNNDDYYSSSAVVRRFERIADSADEFLRFVQLGGRPRQYLFFDPLIAHLFAGKLLTYQILHDGSQYHYFSICPMSFEERGLEAMLSFIYEDCKVPKNSFRLRIMLRLSESTDIMGITAKCLQLATPQFKSTAEVVIRELTLLPTQDFSWLSQYECESLEHWNNVHSTLTQRFRPDPLCCYRGYIPACSSNSTRISSLSSIFPEPVSDMFLQCHISLSEYNNMQGSPTTRDDTSSLDNFPLLKIGILFTPHDSVEDLKLVNANKSYVVETIDGGNQLTMDVDVTQHRRLEEMLPKAIDYLYQNAEASTYQVSWKSKHGSAHFGVVKTSMAPMLPGARRTTRRQGRRNKIEAQMIKNGQWKEALRDYLKLLAMRSSDDLQCWFMAWLNHRN